MAVDTGELILALFSGAGKQMVKERQQKLEAELQSKLIAQKGEIDKKIAELDRIAEKDKTKARIEAQKFIAGERADVERLSALLRDTQSEREYRLDKWDKETKAKFLKYQIERETEERGITNPEIKRFQDDMSKTIQGTTMEQANMDYPGMLLLHFKGATTPKGKKYLADRIKRYTGEEDIDKAVEQLEFKAGFGGKDKEEEESYSGEGITSETPLSIMYNKFGEGKGSYATKPYNAISNIMQTPLNRLYGLMTGDETTPQEHMNRFVKSLFDGGKPTTEPTTTQPVDSLINMNKQPQPVQTNDAMSRLKGIPTQAPAYDTSKADSIRAFLKDKLGEEALNRMGLQ